MSANLCPFKQQKSPENSASVVAADWYKHILRTYLNYGKGASVALLFIIIIGAFNGLITLNMACLLVVTGTIMSFMFSIYFFQSRSAPHFLMLTIKYQCAAFPEPSPTS